jgi:apolipoprotein D and lipocalin family protein
MLCQEPTTVPTLDLQRYLGTWYEIARLPMRYEPADYTDISATYSLQPDGKLRVQNRALDGNGERQESIGEATVVPGSGNAKLEVTFLPEGLRWIPFTKGDYWVLRIDHAYHTAIVGGPDRKYLWLLSRSPGLDAATREDFLGTARAQGYDLADLIHAKHSGQPAITDA